MSHADSSGIHNGVLELPIGLSLRRSAVAHGPVANWGTPTFRILQTFFAFFLYTATCCA